MRALEDVIVGIGWDLIRHYEITKVETRGANALSDQRQVTKQATEVATGDGGRHGCRAGGGASGKTARGGLR